MSGTSISSQTQRIIVAPASGSISVINAGPQGPQGIPGATDIDTLLTVDGQLVTRVAGELAPITRADLAADPVFRMVPIGTVLDYAGPTAPTHFLMIDGSTIVNGQTLYPDLWVVIPASWKSGSNIVFPDARGRTAIGAGTGSGLTNRTLGSVGGAETHTLTAAESGVPTHSHPLGTHTHGMKNHTHTSAPHDHELYAGIDRSSAGNEGWWAWGTSSNSPGPPSVGGGASFIQAGGGFQSMFKVQSMTPAATGGPSDNTTTGPTGSSDNNTASNAASGHTNMQPWLALNKIICCQ